MLKWGRNHPWLAAVLIGGATLAVLFAISLLVPLVGDLCSYGEQTHKSECAKHHLGPLALFWIIEAVDEHNGFVTAIATALLTAITYMLVSLGQEQSRTTRAQLRAYIDIQADVENVKIDGRPRITVTFRNVGQTPAYDFYTSSDMTIGPAKLPEGVDLPSPFIRMKNGTAHFVSMGKGILGPTRKAHNGLMLDRPLTEEILQALGRGEKALYHYGVVRFRDCFERYWEISYRYICGGSASVDGLYSERCDEKQITESDHKGTLLLAGETIPASFPPPNI
jgi:hypothetical protein